MSLRYSSLENYTRGESEGGHVVVLGSKEDLSKAVNALPGHITSLTGVSSGAGGDVVTSLLSSVVDKLSPSNDGGSSLDVFLPGSASTGNAIRVTLAALPSGTASRHNTPSRSHAAADLVKGFANGEYPLKVLILLTDKDHALALGTAVARVFPLYSQKSTAKPPRKVSERGPSIIIIIIIIIDP